MSDKNNIEQSFKAAYEKLDFAYSESLWQKMDAALVPYRNEEKRKRRIAAYWWAAAASVLLIGGAGIAYNYIGGNSATVSKMTKLTTSNSHTTTSTTEQHTTPTEMVTGEKLGNTTAETNPTANTNQASVYNKTLSSSSTLVDNKEISSLNVSRKQQVQYQKQINLKQPNSANELATSYKKKNEKAMQESTLTNAMVDVDLAAPDGKRVVTVEKTADVPTTATQLPVAIQSVDLGANADNKFSEIATNAASNTNTVAVKNNGSTKLLKKNLEMFAVGGINVSSSFKQPGYFAGITTVLNVKDKRIFAGVRMNSNKLNHELIASKNAVVGTQNTDAVINKLTTLQLSLGYQFKLNSKKTKNNTYLSTGFEPSYATGVQTIFYDNQGIPGGPRTPVFNSPLLNKAINRFNVSFLVGLEKYLSNRLAINFQSGYNLIGITDRQYYNRTSKNNNLRYAQIGLQFKLR